MFKLTQKAKSDLKNIAEYTQQQWGKQQRDKYIVAKHVIRYVNDKPQIVRILYQSMDIDIYL